MIGPKAAWDNGSILGTGEETSQTLDLPRGHLEPLDPVLLPGRPHPLGPRLLRSADRRPRRPAPEHDQPRQQRPVLARRQIQEQGRRDRVHDQPDDASGLQSLTGYDGQAYLGELVAVPAEPHKMVPLSEACGSWIDWYECPATP